jgi:predicted DCC family thiol-disulfide oxidoreductase YuxK
MASSSPDRQRWLVLYDEDCGFCRWSLSMLLRADRGRRLRPVALQSSEAASLLSDLSAEQRMASWHLISPDGRRQSAGAALPALASLLPGGGAVAAGLSRMPRVNERGYGWVADHRSVFGRLIPDGAKVKADALIAKRSQP